MPTFHPAALLGQQQKRPVWEDFKEVKATWKHFPRRKLDEEKC